MLDSFKTIVVPIIAFLESKYGVVGSILGYVVLFGIPFLSVLMELADFVVALTKSTKDDEAVSKAESYLKAVMPYLEVLPHVNVPLSLFLQKVLYYAKKALAAALGAKKAIDEDQTPPPSA